MDLDIVKKNLEARRFTAHVFETVNEALKYLNDTIDSTTVGMGGSVTLTQMGLYDTLSTHNEVYWHGNAEQVKELGSPAIQKKASTTDVYITSANGLSAQGQLINIDGAGNRIASTVFGHRKVYFIVGKNKVADTYDEALWRARNIAAPKNAQRLNMNTPCAIKGDKCYDCKSPDRICRGFMTIEMPLMGQEIEVILINEELGY